MLTTDNSKIISYAPVYFLGNDKSKWASNVKKYGKTVYQNIYENIDLKFYWFSLSRPPDEVHYLHLHFSISHFEACAHRCSPTRAGIFLCDSPSSFMNSKLICLHN